jgi:hypothetical protein
VAFRDPRTGVAVGGDYRDVSFDGGRHWRQFHDGSFDSVDCTRDGACWASGARGAIGALTLG